MIRANVMETMNEDYVRTARAKGAPERQVMRSHVLRNAMLAVVTMLGMDIGLALGGAIFTETVFGLPGPRQGGDREHLQLRPADHAGRSSSSARSAIIVFNLFVDLFYAWIDPRIRLADDLQWRCSRFTDLRTSFRTDDGVVKAVDGVSFSIEKGQTLGIVGESGCGKSVTCLTIMGLNAKRNTISSGQALWKGEDLLTMPQTSACATSAATTSR